MKKNAKISILISCISILFLTSCKPKKGIVPCPGHRNSIEILFTDIKQVGVFIENMLQKINLDSENS